MTNEKNKRKAFVVFKESNDDRIFPKKFLRYGFSHVFVVLTDDVKVHGNTHKQFLQCDPLFGTMFLETFSLSEKNVIKAFKDKDYHILELVIEKESPVYACPQIRFKLFTCVSIIKYILGIKCFAITPYQLFKRLLKMEGKQGIVSVKQIN